MELPLKRACSKNSYPFFDQNTMEFYFQHDPVSNCIECVESATGAKACRICVVSGQAPGAGSRHSACCFELQNFHCTYLSSPGEQPGKLACLSKIQHLLVAFHRQFGPATPLRGRGRASLMQFFGTCQTVDRSAVYSVSHCNLLH